MKVSKKDIAPKKKVHKFAAQVYQFEKCLPVCPRLKNSGLEILERTRIT